MNILRNVSIALMICGVSFANSTNETEKGQLMQQIQDGNPVAMLEAGKSGDPRMIPALEGFLQARSNAVEETLSGLAKAFATDEERRKFTPPREALMGNEYDTAAQNARMALAKLGAKKYLDEIVRELIDPTNSTLFRVCYSTLNPHAYGYRIRVQALRKLAYVKNPSTIKFVASFLNETESPNVKEPSDVARSPLASHAIAALRSMVDNPPATDDFKTWQQWWEQNKDKYP